ETRSYAGLERFFESPRFHRAISQDRPLVLAFAAFLADEAAGLPRRSALPEMIRFETACARARRAERAPPPARGLTEAAYVARAPGVSGLAFPFDVIAAVQRVERYLFELAMVPQLALCDDAPRLGPLVPEPGERRILISPDGAGGAALHDLDPGLL